MGHTNQAEIYKNQRKASCIQAIFDLKRVKDRFANPEFVKDPAGIDGLQVAMKIDKLIEYVTTMKDRM